MKRAVIFDLDGVIVSTDEFHYLAWNEIAEEEGIPFSREINDRLRGVSRLASLEIILEKANHPYSQKEKEFLAEKKNAIYRSYLMKMDPSYLSLEVKSTLLKLREDGHLLGLGSSSKNTELILSKIGLDGFFDAIADGNDITHSKPNPEVFLLAAKRLSISPSLAYVVEDAEAGVEAALAGGFIPVGIGPASQSPLACYRIQRFFDLLAIVQKD